MGRASALEHNLLHTETFTSTVSSTVAAPSPAPSRAPSPAPIVHVPLDIERVKSEIRSFIRSSNLNGDVKLNDLLQHLQPLFVGPINATSRDAIRNYAAEIAVK